MVRGWDKYLIPISSRNHDKNLLQEFHFEHFPLRCVVEYFVALRRIRVGAFGPWLESGTRLWALPGLGYDDVRYDWMRVVWP